MWRPGVQRLCKEMHLKAKWGSSVILNQVKRDVLPCGSVAFTQSPLGSERSRPSCTVSPSPCHGPAAPHLRMSNQRIVTVENPNCLVSTGFLLLVFEGWSKLFFFGIFPSNLFNCINKKISPSYFFKEDGRRYDGWSHYRKIMNYFCQSKFSSTLGNSIQNNLVSMCCDCNVYFLSTHSIERNSE